MREDDGHVLCKDYYRYVGLTSSIRTRSFDWRVQAHALIELIDRLLITSTSAFVIPHSQDEVLGPSRPWLTAEFKVDIRPHYT